MPLTSGALLAAKDLRIEDEMRRTQSGLAISLLIVPYVDYLW